MAIHPCSGRVRASDRLRHPLPGMILIPAGSFFIGSEDWGEFEKPAHEVYLDDFWMDETPVTNHQFAKFVAETGYSTECERTGAAWGYRDNQYSKISGLSWRTYALSGREDHPVVLVSWNDALAYADWAGKRLPTEAEWEKAARGGSTERLFPWGDQPPDGSQCNLARSPSEIPPTTAVKNFSPNAYGLCDMVGNVWQWCADWYSDGYYRIAPANNPKGPETGITRVRRGGAWNVIQPFRLRSANRGTFDPSGAAPNLGFRCAF